MHLVVSVKFAFNQLKNRVFSSDKLPMRIDDFKQKHIDSIEGSLTLTAANINCNENIGESTFVNQMETEDTNNYTREDHCIDINILTNQTTIIGDELEEVVDSNKNDKLDITYDKDIEDLTSRDLVRDNTPKEQLCCGICQRKVV